MKSELGPISVVGGGLAGSECALQLAERGFQVRLYEMRGAGITTPAHKTKNMAELVCSNTFGSVHPTSAPGQLKWEAEALGSFVLESALKAHVPAGQALGMDRDIFSQGITERVLNHPRIEVVYEAVHSLDDLPRPAVVATGPLTADRLAESMKAHFGSDFLYFFDAIAPIIDADSIDMSKVWRADRWDKGTSDYLNCPLNKEEYYALVEAIDTSRKIEPKDFENTIYFESCMPVEEIVRRGPETLRFGPLSPKGLKDPKTRRWPYAVVQLRQENRAGTAYNMVGFQTKMAYPDQKRVFRMIPGLENAEFLKLGSMHRNLFINSPVVLTPLLCSKKDPQLFFAGQITGVEGYFESACMGLYVALALESRLNSTPFEPPPPTTAFGALIYRLTGEVVENFQPMNINFGIMPKAPVELSKHEKRLFYTNRAKKDFATWIKQFSVRRAPTERLLEDLSGQFVPAPTPQ
jgi:methylenetetrahydrofolate--tRNA-(uracil-5-)-methyltransferase